MQKQTMKSYYIETGLHSSYLTYMQKVGEGGKSLTFVLREIEDGNGSSDANILGDFLDSLDPSLSRKRKDSLDHIKFLKITRNIY